MITIHAISDLLTFFSCMLISTLVVYIYCKGQLRLSRAAYPRLWILGAGFMAACGLSYLGNFLEIWYGGYLYWITGFNKLLMAIISLCFVVVLNRRKEDIVIIGRVLMQVQEEEEK